MAAKLICGGVYEKRVGKVVFHALCIATRHEGTTTQGYLQVFGHALERVTEGSDAMTGYELVAGPTRVESRRRKAG